MSHSNIEYIPATNESLQPHHPVRIVCQLIVHIFKEKLSAPEDYMIYRQEDVRASGERLYEEDVDVLPRSEE